MHLKTSYGFVVLFLLLAACMWETVDTMSNQPQVDSWQCPHYHLQPSLKASPCLICLADLADGLAEWKQVEGP